MIWKEHVLICFMVYACVCMVSKCDAAGYNDSCTSTTECTGSVGLICGINQVCTCNGTHYYNTGSSCEKKSLLGDPCIDYIGCADANAVCACSSYRCYTTYDCRCNYMSYDDNGVDSGGVCQRKKLLGETCSTIAICAEKHSFCSENGTCKCNNRYFDDNSENVIGGVCRDTTPLGDPCSFTVTCSDSNSFCSDGKCKCNPQYYDDNGESEAGGGCQLTKYLGEACSAIAKCADANAVCSDAVCICRDAYYDDNGPYNGGGVCRPKFILGLNCSTNATCTWHDLNSFCSASGICKCKDTYYDDNGVSVEGGICRDKKLIGDPCNATIECADDNTFCNLNGSIGKCKCNTQYYDDNGDMDYGGVCQTRKLLGETCSTIASCADANSFCSGNGTCKCHEPYFDDNGESVIDGVCREKKRLGETCSNISKCYAANSYCSDGKCKCNHQYYDDNGESVAGGICRQPCEPGMFGMNCSSPCHCLNESICDHVSGNCPSDRCAPGWTHRNCSVAEVSISTTECPDFHSDKYFNALLAVAIVLGVVVVALAVLNVVSSTRKHRQCFGGTRANSESSHQNMYDDLGPRSANPDHYDSLPMPTIGQQGR